MTRKSHYLAAALLVALCAAAPAAARSEGNGNGHAKLLPPQAAQAAIDATGAVTVSPVQRITPAQARAFAQEPGSDTEGVEPAVAGDPSNSSLAPLRTAAVSCYYGSVGAGWGWWPYQQNVTNATSWCGGGGTLTYRTTHVFLDTFFCSSHDAYGYREAGGVGNGYEQEAAGGYFDCPTSVPWITLHERRQFSTVVTWYGGMWTV